MNSNCCCHVHRYYGCTSVTDGHSHYYNCISDPAENCRCHKHCLRGVTACADGHVHTFKFFTGFDIPIWGGRHIHCYFGVTDVTEGHVHCMAGYTLKEC